MPIEIKITELHKLTEGEINKLHIYLLACSNPNVDIQIYSTDKPLKASIPCEVTLTPKNPTMLVPDAEMNAVAVEIDNVKYFDSEPKPIDPLKEMMDDVHSQHPFKKTESSWPFDTVQKPININHVGVVDIPPNINCKVLKLRKKRTPKAEKPEGEIHKLEMPEPMFTIAESEISYDTLITFILENTRNKKMGFVQVIPLLAKFEVPNLKELPNFPHVIQPFYEALKEMIND